MGKWLLIKDARRSMLRWWNPISAIVFFLWLLQVIMGRYRDAEAEAIIWLVINVFIVAFLLYSGLWLNKFPEKVIPPGAHRTILFILILLLVADFLTLLLIGPATAMNGIGHKTYLLRSFLWLTPVNVLAIAGIAALFYRKEPLVRPNPQIIRGLVSDEAGEAKEKNYIIREQCLELIAGNNINEVFSRMKTVLEGQPDCADQLVQIQSRYNAIQKEIRMNTIEPDKSQIIVNQIITALLELTREINR